MKKAVISSALGLASVLAVPAVALAAATPTFTNDVIVPNVSIGQLKLSESPAVARKSFPGKDCNTSGCDYGAADGAWSVSVVFVQTSKHAKPIVGQISILASKPDTPVDSLKTTRSIGIGSTAAQVKKAYPHTTGSPAEGGYVIAGQGEHRTNFQISNGRVIGVTMSSVRLG
jgi:hypothetical protein